MLNVKTLSRAEMKTVAGGYVPPASWWVCVNLQAVVTDICSTDNPSGCGYGSCNYSGPCGENVGGCGD